ncbi:uncharacterized protein LOC114265681 isoform X2 [Camellia sinensis]|uniref:uncharacterized protein LOC114265681 isoform X2 n=1 Tax=Camellia sinensis TaxID=4442 RepID=UPI0010357370|nr:uncharacterized protein LOC114265681 isoform X2 [Camellia sinensis]
MAFSLSCAATSSSASSLSAWWIPQYLKHRNEDSFVEFKNCNPRQPKKKNVVLVGVSIFSIKSESKDYSSSSSSSEEESRRKSRRLEIGSPIIVTEAPKMIKTATAVPCLRLNSGLVNPGDVGRKDYTALGPGREGNELGWPHFALPTLGKIQLAFQTSTFCN